MIDPKWHAKHCPPGALTAMLKARFDEPIEEALSEKRIASILRGIDRRQAQRRRFDKLAATLAANGVAARPTKRSGRRRP